MRSRCLLGTCLLLLLLARGAAWAAAEPPPSIRAYHAALPAATAAHTDAALEPKGGSR